MRQGSCRRTDWRTGAVSYRDLRTDADFSFVRSRKDGSREFGFIYGCRVEHAGAVLSEMPENIEMYQGKGDFRVQGIKDKMPRWHQELARP